MEAYEQITLDQWLQWKEDIRRKLDETAGNFVHIGYRLKQIRDSGMYDGAADVFEFAAREFGLGKSTVSRFIAINEKYSEGGNSLELKEEFRGFSSSKLSEMLTLPDSEIQLITERTTIREIRELKGFNSQEPEGAGKDAEACLPEKGNREAGWTPLEVCLIDFFRARKGMLNDVMQRLDGEPAGYRQAAELMAPSGQASHRKGIVFLFLYDWNTGAKYKLMTAPDPVAMGWRELLDIVRGIYGGCCGPDVWGSFYEEQGTEKRQAEDSAPAQPDQGEGAVAMSQRDNTVEPESGQGGTGTEEAQRKLEDGAGEPAESMAEEARAEEPLKAAVAGEAAMDMDVPPCGKEEEAAVDMDMPPCEKEEDDAVDAALYREELWTEAWSCLESLRKYFSVWDERSIPMESLEKVYQDAVSLEAAIERLLDAKGKEGEDGQEHHAQQG